MITCFFSVYRMAVIFCNLWLLVVGCGSLKGGCKDNFEEFFSKRCENKKKTFQLFENPSKIQREL